MDVYSLFVSAIFFPFIETPLPMREFMIAILYVGLMQFIAYSLFYIALDLGDKPAYVMIFNSGNILFSFLISVLWYGEKVVFVAILGAAMILTSMIMLGLNKSEEKEEKWNDMIL